MRNRRHLTKVATRQRDHTHLLLAVLYLGGVALLFNAWLVTQGIGF